MTFVDCSRIGLDTVVSKCVFVGIYPNRQLNKLGTLVHVQMYQLPVVQVYMYIKILYRHTVEKSCCGRVIFSRVSVQNAEHGDRFAIRVWYSNFVP